MSMIVEIGNIDRKPDVIKVRSWSKLVLHVESSNVIDVEEAST